MSDITKNHDLNTWVLLGVLATSDLMMRIVFLFGAWGAPDCYFLADFLEYETSSFLSIYKIFKTIWWTVFALSVIELFRCFWFRWKKKVFVVVVNFLIAATSLYVSVKLVSFQQYFDYERGLVPLEQTDFALSDELVTPSYLYEPELTEEFTDYYRSQCTRRVIHGDFSAELSITANKENYENLTGKEVFNPNYEWYDYWEHYLPTDKVNSKFEW